MSAKPENIPKREIDEQEVEQLLEQRELLDATELIAKMGHCQWDYRNNRLISCSQGYARIFNMSVDETIEFQNDWEKSLGQFTPKIAIYISTLTTRNRIRAIIRSSTDFCATMVRLAGCAKSAC